MPEPLGPRTATTSPSPTASVTPSSAATSPKWTLTSSTRSIRTSLPGVRRMRSTRKTESGGHDHQHDGERIRLRGVHLARAAEEAEDRDRQRGVVRPREEDRRAELAERDREREACRHRERTTDDRKVDLPPHASGRGAEQRGGLALALVDRAQRRRDDPDDERQRDERLRDGHDPRRRRGSRPATGRTRSRSRSRASRPRRRAGA